ncbi:protein of unknown function [Haloechinothrix alba]|uniref:DUF4439 domain-containing protein n=1 Tax=Haloechinothrix alba TaxID=664784 RepID=A0A238WDZ8_9PSEU|nr:ferritin-like domain-containing protein [Haloechinothrix alba]SNR44816.1 protein of unknown function [Haloechinothrix alba]
MGTEPNRRVARIGRRRLLRVTALAAVSGSLAACVEGYDATPDPLVPLARDARFDAAAADDLATASADRDAALAGHVARVRAAHADALRAEVRRANRPAPEHEPEPASEVAGIGDLGRRLDAAVDRVRDVLGGVPRHRAALLGSVAGGCAAARALDERLGDAVPDEFAVRAPQDAGTETVPAVQEALAAEHAAVWVFDLVRAFLPQDLDTAIDHSIDQHRRRRAGCRELLVALGATPVPAEPGYRPPDPVTGADSATRLAMQAGAEAGRAWRGVLERTDDQAVRRFALDALLSAGAESSRWRLVAEENPQPDALVGQA